MVVSVILVCRVNEPLYVPVEVGANCTTMRLVMPGRILVGAETTVYALGEMLVLLMNKVSQPVLVIANESRLVEFAIMESKLRHVPEVLNKEIPMCAVPITFKVQGTTIDGVAGSLLVMVSGKV